MSNRIPLIQGRAWNGPWAFLPNNVREYPTMLTREELRMLRWMAQCYYSGAGSICDLGAFLGGSTVAFADGLRAAGHRDKQIVHSFDFYTADARLWPKYLPEAVRPDDGNMFPHAKALLSDYLDLISFNRGNFIEQPVPEGPIEICFVDISKTISVNDHIVRQYFPRLIPGQSIVIQQDYFFPVPLWDIATMEILSDYFEIIGACDTNSAVFLNTKQIDNDAIEKASSQNFSLDVFKRCIASASAKWPQAAHKAQLFKAMKVADSATFMSGNTWDYPDAPRDHEISQKDVFQGLT